MEGASLKSLRSEEEVEEREKLGWRVGQFFFSKPPNISCARSPNKKGTDVKIAQHAHRVS